MDATGDGVGDFEAVAEGLEGAGIRRGRMMGRPMLSIGGRMFACLVDGGLTLRLGAGSASYARALALPGAVVFAPGADRVFRDWVVVPVAHATTWPEFADAALAYAESLPPAPPRARPRVPRRER
ncbi:hypothetical protein CLV46_2448 [Diaminobutyricimonas aerilata]|uniref:TfoX-like protein n=1 Tax=Diaminobutyricimonas aerilata TaxID=1162967 RepID=A0A2M9CLV3_9MICO|nr:hypothetical protein [Diaminobutyricimonas aerilata]PJJ72871.1 hypothetical protein CLV46_2448 [Diaminobutyricimonas aerilata]